MCECYYPWCENHQKDEPFCSIDECTATENQLIYFAKLRAEEANAPFDKIQWLDQWCTNNGLKLSLYGTCGFGRDCVGIIDPISSSYPDYHWYDKETYEFIDDNGFVWTPDNAYHKHTCVAVLGYGNESILQLYEWIKWFDDNGFVIERGEYPEPEDGWDELDILFGDTKYVRMIKSK